MTTPTPLPVLLPCPFCGGQAEADQFHPETLNEWRYICEQCEAWGPERLTREDARTAWNTRLLSTPGQADGLRDAIARIVSPLDWQQQAKFLARSEHWNAQASDPGGFAKGFAENAQQIVQASLARADAILALTAAAIRARALSLGGSNDG